MNKILANVKMVRKLVILVGAAVVQLICLIGVAWWGFDSVSSTMAQQTKEMRRMFLAMRISSDVNTLAVSVANAMAVNRVDSEALNRIAFLRKEYLGDFVELATLSATAEGKRLREDMEGKAAEWRELNLHILDAIQNRKKIDAAAFSRQHQAEETALRASMVSYVTYRQQRLALIDEQQQATATRARTLLLGLGALWLVVSMILGSTIARGVTKPLEAAVFHLNEVARGNITSNMPAEYLERKDEIGSLATALHTMSVSLSDVLGKITDNIHVVSSSATELSSNSGHMSQNSKQASEKAHSVAAAAEQMSANVTSVAAGMEQTSSNLTHVAAHTEQMTATIGEIAGNSEKARRITEEASRQAVQITHQMNELGQAAQEIGKVTEAITEISSQTNLLALNAAIEAARAGSAGKGFAVVANEIKELAQQTATATEDIKKRIGGVQTSTLAGITEIEKISRVIHEVSEIVASTAAAIEEQATATMDIARNIGEASNGVRDANVRISEASEATSAIAKEIIGVDATAKEMAEGSDQVRYSATDLSRAAEQLQAAVSRFRYVGQRHGCRRRRPGRRSGGRCRPRGHRVPLGVAIASAQSHRNRPDGYSGEYDPLRQSVCVREMAEWAERPATLGAVSQYQTSPRPLPRRGFQCRPTRHIGPAAGSRRSHGDVQHLRQSVQRTDRRAVALQLIRRRPWSIHSPRQPARRRCWRPSSCATGITPSTRHPSRR